MERRLSINFTKNRVTTSYSLSLILKLCLAREFTYCHIRNVIRLALSDVSFIFRDDLVCGVRTDLRSLVLISCGCV